MFNALKEFKLLVMIVDACNSFDFFDSKMKSTTKTKDETKSTQLGVRNFINFRAAKSYQRE